MPNTIVAGRMQVNKRIRCMRRVKRFGMMFSAVVPTVVARRLASRVVRTKEMPLGLMRLIFVQRNGTAVAGNHGLF